MPTSNSEYVFRNWDKTIECNPKYFYQPETEEEVVAVVREVEARGGVLRALGAGHSWSSLVPTEDSIVNLDSLNRVVSVDAARQRVTMQAGIRLKDLFEQLASRGLTLGNSGS